MRGNDPKSPTLLRPSFCFPQKPDKSTDVTMSQSRLGSYKSLARSVIDVNISIPFVTAILDVPAPPQVEAWTCLKKTYWLSLLRQIIINPTTTANTPPATRTNIAVSICVLLLRYSVSVSSRFVRFFSTSAQASTYASK